MDDEDKAELVEIVKELTAISQRFVKLLEKSVEGLEEPK